MKYEARVTEITVCPVGSTKDDEESTHIAIESAGNGEFVTINQANHTTTFTPEDWPAIREATDQLISDCRNE